MVLWVSRELAGPHLFFHHKFQVSLLILDLVPNDIFHMKLNIYSDSIFDINKYTISKFSLPTPY